MLEFPDRELVHSGLEVLERTDLRVGASRCAEEVVVDGELGAVGILVVAVGIVGLAEEVGIDHGSLDAVDGVVDADLKDDLVSLLLKAI